MTQHNISQAQRPHGILGRIFAALMERMNERAYQWTVKQLTAHRPASLYELGFGTGRCLEVAAMRLSLKHIRGVDPSELMVEQARTRLRKQAKRMAIDLREGDDTSDFWPEERFDAITALHSFQFWPDPAATLAKLRRQLNSNGTLVIVLRRHDNHRPPNLPNPISHTPDEIEGTRAALRATGFVLRNEEALDKASYGLVCGRS